MATCEQEKRFAVHLTYSPGRGVGTSVFKLLPLTVTTMDEAIAMVRIDEDGRIFDCHAASVEKCNVYMITQEYEVDMWRLNQRKYLADKEQRRKQYEELKKEFGDEPGST